MPLSTTTSDSLFVPPEFARAGASGAPAEPTASDADIPALTRAIARGDECAFREFHARFAGRLLAYALVLHRGNDTAARETWQTTLVKVARHMKPFTSELKLWAWLATVARRTALDAHRSSSRFDRLRERIAGWWQDTPGAGPALVDPVALVRAALARLTEEDRALLEAKYFEDLPVRAIATHSARTEKAVESALSRARVRLREAIQEELRHA